MSEVVVKDKAEMILNDLTIVMVLATIVMVLAVCYC